MTRRRPIRHSRQRGGSNDAMYTGITPSLEGLLAPDYVYAAQHGDPHDGYLRRGHSPIGACHQHATVSYLSSAADGLTKTRSLALRARQGFAFGRRLQIFGEGAYERDRFVGIDGRTTATSGLGYSPATTRRQRITIEGGAGITAEQRVGLDAPRFGSASGAVHYVWTTSWPCRTRLRGRCR
jgi:hypothetical protein